MIRCGPWSRAKGRPRAGQRGWFQPDGLRAIFAATPPWPMGRVLSTSRTRVQIRQRIVSGCPARRETRSITWGPPTSASSLSTPVVAGEILASSSSRRSPGRYRHSPGGTPRASAGPARRARVHLGVDGAKPRWRSQLNTSASGRAHARAIPARARASPVQRTDSPPTGERFLDSDGAGWRGSRAAYEPSAQGLPRSASPFSSRAGPGSDGGVSKEENWPGSGD